MQLGRQNAGGQSRLSSSGDTSRLEGLRHIDIPPGESPDTPSAAVGRMLVALTIDAAGLRDLQGDTALDVWTSSGSALTRRHQKGIQEGQKRRRAFSSPARNLQIRFLYTYSARGTTGEIPGVVLRQDGGATDRDEVGVQRAAPAGIRMEDQVLAVGVDRGAAGPAQRVGAGLKQRQGRAGIGTQERGRGGVLDLVVLGRVAARAEEEHVRASGRFDQGGRLDDTVVGSAQRAVLLEIAVIQDRGRTALECHAIGGHGLDVEWGGVVRCSACPRLAVRPRIRVAVNFPKHVSLALFGKARRIDLASSGEVTNERVSASNVRSRNVDRRCCADAMVSIVLSRRSGEVHDPGSIILSPEVNEENAYQVQIRGDIPAD